MLRCHRRVGPATMSAAFIVLAFLFLTNLSSPAAAMPPPAFGSHHVADLHKKFGSIGHGGLPSHSSSHFNWLPAKIIDFLTHIWKGIGGGGGGGNVCR